MSTSEESAPVTLEVRTGDEASEIFVIDGRYNLVDRAIGLRKEFALEPGIYKVKVCTGTETREEQVLLRPGGGPVVEEFPRLEFASPAPIEDTSKTHEFHMNAAAEHSRRVHVEAGRGSWIFVCARGWSEKVRTDQSAGERPDPARGLKLLDEGGRLVADFEVSSAKNLEWEPWAACNVSVDPGNYRLCLEVPSLGGKVEQAVVASEGWQTQIFLLQHDYGPGVDKTRGAEGDVARDVRADLAGASVMMSGTAGGDPLSPPGFDPGRRDLRLVELARLALVNRRSILSEELRDVLRYKFDNPMLGILGAHLLLAEREFDEGLFAEVIGNLRRLVGGSHPDVEALALKTDPHRTFTFSHPPMLQRSWSLICAATADDPGLVPADSTLSEVSQSGWSSPLWLTWLAPDEKKSEEAPGELSEFEEAVLVLLRAAGRRSVATSGGGLFAVAALVHTAWRWLRSDPARELLPAIRKVLLDDEATRKLTLQLGIPRSTVEKLLKQFEERLKTKELWKALSEKS